MTSFAAGCGFFTCEETRRASGKWQGGGWEKENTHCLFNLGGFRVFCLGFCCVALINSKSVLRVLPKGQIWAHELVSFVPCCSGELGAIHLRVSPYPPASLLSLAATTFGVCVLKLWKISIASTGSTADIYYQSLSSWQFPENKRQLRNALWFPKWIRCNFMNMILITVSRCDAEHFCEFPSSKINSQIWPPSHDNRRIPRTGVFF